MFCNKCGARIDGAGTFCGQCGNRVTEILKNDSPVRETSGWTPNMTPSVANAPSQRGNLLPLVIILAVVAAVSLGILCYILTMRPFGDKIQVSTKVEETTPKKKRPSATPTPSPRSTPTPVPTDRSETNLKAVKQVFDNYMNNLVIGINSGSYSPVEPYILNGSSLSEAQKKLVDNLYRQNITETLLGYTILRTEWVNDRTCYLYVEEKHQINYPSKSGQSIYRWKYTAQNYNGKFYMSAIEKAEE